MDARYPNGDPIFSKCSKLTIRLLQIIGVIASFAFFVVHFTTYFGTHTLANAIPKIISWVAEAAMKAETSARAQKNNSPRLTPEKAPQSPV